MDMKSPVLIILTILVLMASSYQTAIAEIKATFLSEASISADTITLGDIVRFSTENKTTDHLNKIVISSAPAPGEEKQIAVSSLMPSLQAVPAAAGIIWQGAANVTVKQKAIRVTREQLQQLIVSYLAQKKEMLPKGEIRFTSLRAPDEVLLPYGTVSWKVTPSNESIINSSTFSIFFRINDKPAHNCIVRGRVEILKKVVVAAKRIQSNAIIKPDDLFLIKKDISQINSPVFSLNQALGMMAAKTMRAGKPVEEDDIKPPPVVREGQLVTILAHKGNLKITSSGIARKSGGAGDIIRVKNIQSNKLVYARVQSPGIVSVEF
ncbi:MAG: flagella basal body P-ring formation protein FlgA [Desulfobulbus propionicus]|nr:MAG: flagella basal body P-ring formation protein FlgA [Desulfobulbus propionicus]